MRSPTDIRNSEVWRLTFDRRDDAYAVEGEVIHLHWHDDTWFPVFQFGGPELSASAGVSRVLMELRGVLVLGFRGPAGAGRRKPCKGRPQTARYRACGSRMCAGLSMARHGAVFIASPPRAHYQPSLP